MNPIIKRASRKIALSKGQFALVDDEDFDRVNQHTWWAFPYRHGNYRARGRINRKEIYMHRFIINAPKGMCVDHINHDALDNRKFNLRLCTIQQNTFNQGRVNNKHGLKGIYLCSQTNKWVAQIVKDGKRRCIGYFKTKEKAHAEYVKKAKELFGEFACAGNSQTQG